MIKLRKVLVTSFLVTVMVFMSPMSVQAGFGDSFSWLSSIQEQINRLQSQISNLMAQVQELMGIYSHQKHNHPFNATSATTTTQYSFAKNPDIVVNIKSHDEPVIEGDITDISVVTSSSSCNIKRAVFFVDGNRKHIDTTKPFVFHWLPKSGKHTVKVVVTDCNGVHAYATRKMVVNKSGDVKVVVKPANQKKQQKNKGTVKHNQKSDSKNQNNESGADNQKNNNQNQKEKDHNNNGAKQKEAKTPDNGTPVNPTSWYKPKPGTSWFWQLTGKINTNHNVDLYDIDLVDTPQSVIDSLHRKGKKVICYFSAGTMEKYRSDAKQFPKSVLGRTMEDWHDEKWLNVAQYPKFAHVMQKRLDLAVKKRCDGVEPDNVDGYQNKTGFKIKYQDQIRYNRWLAQEAHKRGLSVALKNDVEQVKDLVNDFDFAINEQCFEYDECNLLKPFVAHNKAVLGVEYELKKKKFCAKAKAMKFSWLKMDYDLDGGMDACN